MPTVNKSLEYLHKHQTFVISIFHISFDQITVVLLKLYDLYLSARDNEVFREAEKRVLL